MPFAGTPPDLWDPSIVAKDADRRPVLGAMAPYVGSQYSIEEIWHYYRTHADVHREEEAQLRPLSARIRAFDVPALSGVTFTLSRLRDVAPTLHAVLTERLSGIAWDPVDALRVGRIKKYGLIHEVMEAPIDEATQDPMVLEVYGHLTQVNGQPVGIGWYRELWPDDPADAEDAVMGELFFRLERATYANTRWPGIGVPFYM